MSFTTAQHKVEVSEIQAQVRLSEDFLTKIEELFKGASGDVKQCAEEVAAATENLRNAINRQRSAMVAKLVQKGELALAAKKLEEFYTSPRASDVEDILKLVISSRGEDGLKNAINFVDHVDENLRPFACASIYNDMWYGRFLDNVEILLLESKVSALGANDQLQELKADIKGDVEKLILRLVEEVINNVENAALSKKAIEVCSSQVFNPLIKQIVENFFGSSPVSIRLLVEYSIDLPDLSNQAHVISETYKNLEVFKSLHAEQVIHLWSHTRFLMRESQNFQSADPDIQKLVTEVYGKLSQSKGQYYHALEDYFFNHDRTKLRNFIGKNGHFCSMLSEFIEWYYEGSLELAQHVILVCRNIPMYSNIGRCQKSLYAEMEKNNQLDTFEAFKLFHSVKRTTTYSNYSSTSAYTVEIEQMREKIPRCLKEMLWNESRKCRITNKYFGEPLFVGHGEKGAYCRSQGGSREDQIWNITVDDKSSLLCILQCASLQYLGCKTEYNAAVLVARKCGWMIKKADENHVKIFTVNDLYLTAAPKFSAADNNKRLIQMRTETNTNMQLWKIEFLPNDA